jgi:hypothetical protein
MLVSQVMADKIVLDRTQVRGLIPTDGSDCQGWCQRLEEAVVIAAEQSVVGLALLYAVLRRKW